MSILLEALKQKNSQATSKAPDRTSSSVSIAESSETSLSLSRPNNLANDSTGATPEPMEALVSMLEIEPPPGLSWQLNASAKTEDSSSKIDTPENAPKSAASTVNTQAPSLAPLSFDLILPTPTPSVPVLNDEQPVSSSGLTTTQADSLNVKATPVLTDSEIKDSKVLSNRTSNLSTENSEPSETSLNAKPEQVETKTTTLGNESPLKSIRMPVVEKTPLSAKRFLSFSRPAKQSTVEENSAENTDGPKPYQPAQHHVRQPLMVLGGVVIGMGVLGYATLSIWESQQQAHLQQMARYKNQTLTDLPERPVVATNSMNVVPSEPLAATVATPMPENKPTIVELPSAEPSHKIASKERPIDQTQSSMLSLKDSSKIKPLDTTRYLPKSNVSDVTVVQSQPTVDWLLQAYEAYERGDWQKSEHYYRLVLEKQPNQRDALLGILAIYQLNEQKRDAASGVADRLRRLYPNDNDVRLATEGLLDLSKQYRLSETELKQTQQQMSNPSEASFRLGLTLAEQQRWSEAQAAFFEAVRVSPNNPDYRLNLAVSYDHLGKYRLALDHYQQYLKLSKARAFNTDTSMIQQRIDYLLPLIASES